MDTGNTRKLMNTKNVNPVEDVQMKRQQAKEKRGTPPQRPHHGLINQGATCYLNSVLQVLFMTTELHDRLHSQSPKDVHLRKIFEGLKETTRGTENFTATFGIKNVYEHRDAAECLEMILRQISPEASEVFRSQMIFTRKCSNGHIINVNPKTFWTVHQLLKDTLDTTFNVQNSFASNFQMEITGDDMVYCCKCMKITEATIESEMVESPQILIILLKRFDFDSSTRSHFKSDCCVEVPCELQWKNKTYKLYGMVNHMGGLTGGHYTATVLSEDNTWYECDDSHVSKVKHLFSEDKTFSSRTVHLLMYRALQGLHYSRHDQGDTNDLNLLSLNNTYHTTYSEESGFEKIVNTKSFTGDNKVEEKMKTTSSSAKKMITEHKVELIDCLMADHSYILQHAHAKQIIGDNQYRKIKQKCPSTPQETVIDLIDEVIFNGQESCTLFFEILKLPDVLSTYPQLKEIVNNMLRSNSGSNT